MWVLDAIEFKKFLKIFIFRKALSKNESIVTISHNPILYRVGSAFFWFLVLCLESEGYKHFIHRHSTSTPQRLSDYENYYLNALMSIKCE